MRILFGGGPGRGPEAATGVAEQAALFAAAPAAPARGLFGRVLGQVQETFVVSASDDSAARAPDPFPVPLSTPDNRYNFRKTPYIVKLQHQY